MMRYWYDTEFLETGRTIDLISIGIVAEDGREYYAVNHELAELSLRGWRLRRKIRKHSWLMANVIPHLPKSYGDARNYMPMSWLFNYTDRAVKPRQRIAREIRDFLLWPGEPVELWAYYGAYDHVVMSWLWGPMVNRPRGIPMWTNDIMQLCHGDETKLPAQIGTAHNALDDARHTRAMWEALTTEGASDVRS